MASAAGQAGVEVIWPRLAVCIALTTVLSLSVHVVMLDVLGIDHPSIEGVPRLATWMNEVLSVTATLVFYRLGLPAFQRLPALHRGLLLTVIYAMLNEALLRSFIMDVVVSHDWIYCLVENMARPLEYLAICSLIVFAAPRLKSAPAVAAGGIVITALALSAIDPPIDRAFGSLVASLEFLDTGNIYNPPYGWQVDVPSYLTFLEPVIASYAIAALVWKRLSRNPAQRLGQFVLVVLSMKGSIVPLLIYSFYQDRPLPAAMLSESQFALEILVMAILTSLGWRYGTRASPAPPSAPPAPVR
jgi:hypothetical protein